MKEIGTTPSYKFFCLSERGMLRSKIPSEGETAGTIDRLDHSIHVDHNVLPLFSVGDNVLPASHFLFSGSDCLPTLHPQVTCFVTFYSRVLEIVSRSRLRFRLLSLQLSISKSK